MNGISVEHDGVVLRIRLDRPGKLNAVDTPMLDELSAHIGGAEADESVRAVLLRGAERGGCPGRIGLPVDVDRPAGRGAEPEPAHQEGVDLLKHKTSTDLMCT